MAQPVPLIASNHTSAPAPHPFFYGWVIAAVSALGVACSVSVYIPATTSLLAGSWAREFGWSIPAVFLALNFATVATIFIAPFIGSLLDRFGARRVIAASFLAEALIVYSFRYQGPDIRWLYARYAAFAIFATGTTAIAFSAVTSRWFDRRRGLALGIALAGLGAGGVMWSLLTQWLIARQGWREIFVYLSAGLLCVVLPLMLLALRETPESMGLRVDGATPEVAARARAPITGVTLRSAMRQRQYWLLVVTFYFIAFATYSITLNLVPLLRARGVDAGTAAAAQASIWAVLVVGRISTGWLMDRFFAPRVALLFLLPPVVGIALLAQGANDTSAFVAAMLVGLAAGAEVDVLAYLAGRYFGLKHFGAIYATFFAIYAVGTSTGPAATAWLVDRTGGYSTPLWCLVGLLCVSGALLLRYPPFPPEPAGR
jgi:MFS family permease